MNGWSQLVSYCVALKILIRDFIWRVGAEWFAQLAPYQGLHTAGDELGLSGIWTVQEMLFSTALLRGEKSHVTERSVKGPAWNQREDTTNMLSKRIITSACRFFFFLDLHVG